MYRGRSAQPKEEHEYSSTQFNMPENIADAVMKFGKSIPDAAIGEEGREMEPHVTAFYGLKSGSPEDTRGALKDQEPITVKLGKTSLFENDDADVLKIDVDSPELEAINKKLRKFPNGNEHPEFEAHVTIAYLKPGKGKPYAGKSIPDITGKSVPLDTLIFSSKNGEKTHIPLRPRARYRAA